jgi:hypothetical protein
VPTSLTLLAITGPLDINGNVDVDGTLTADNVSGTNTGDQLVYATITGGSGTTTAATTASTLTIAGAGIATTAATADTLTVTATEADTLQSVTDRGATTTTASTFSGGLTSPNLRATTSAGVELLTSGGTQTALFGAGGSPNATLPATNVNGAIAATGTVTGSNLSGTNTGDQDVYTTVTGDTGSTTAASPTGSLAIVGTGDIVTTATLNTITIGYTGGGGGGSGDVVGPASSTDNALVRWDGTTGKLVQDSDITWSSNVLSMPEEGAILWRLSPDPDIAIFEEGGFITSNTSFRIQGGTQLILGSASGGASIGSSGVSPTQSPIVNGTSLILNTTNATLQFGISSPPVLSQGAANRLDLGSGQSFRVQADGQVQFGTDSGLRRFASNTVAPLSNGNLAVDNNGEVRFGNDTALRRTGAGGLSLVTGTQLRGPSIRADAAKWFPVVFGKGVAGDGWTQDGAPTPADVGERLYAIDSTGQDKFERLPQGIGVGSRITRVRLYGLDGDLGDQAQAEIKLQRRATLSASTFSDVWTQTLDLDSTTKTADPTDHVVEEGYIYRLRIRSVANGSGSFTLYSLEIEADNREL